MSKQTKKKLALSQVDNHLYFFQKTLRHVLHIPCVCLFVFTFAIYVNAKAEERT